MTDASASPMYPGLLATSEGDRKVLDEFDVRLVQLLTDDGRASTRDLARVLGLRENTVAARLRRLMSRNILRIRAVVDWHAAGYVSPVLLFLDVEGRRVTEVVDALAGIDHVQSVCRVFGSVDIISRVLLSGNENLASFRERLGREIPEARVVHLLPELEVAKYLGTFHAVPPLDTKLVPFPAPNVDLDELDLRLLGVLIHDARQSWRSIARQLGVSEGTVRSRFKLIEQSGLAKVMAQIDPVAARIDVDYAWLGLEVADGAVDEVVRRAVQRPEISVVSRTVGRFDVLAFAALPSRRAAGALVDDLRDAPGVRRTEAWSLSAVHVSRFPWGRIDS
ncbi:MAG: Lrp/AsnC family transcriptional regulator [Ilumatobacteraceae bacterium]